VQPRYDVFSAPEGYPPTPETFIEQLASVVRRAGDQPAVVDQDRALSYTELWDNAARLAGWLRRSGCGDGDRVCIDVPNSVSWVESLLGILFAGLVAVPLDQRATPEFRAFVQEDSGARMTLADRVAVRDDEESHVDTGVDGSLAMLLYTSGTTGQPKGVMISHANLASYRSITASYLGRSIEEGPVRNLIAIPLSHSAGCNTQLLPTLALGGTAFIAPGSGPDSVIGALRRWQPDLMFAVPVIYRRLLDATTDDRSVLRCLRDVHFGAASTPAALVRDLREALPWARLGNAFGMTEISNVALFLPDDHLDAAAGSVGFPVPGVQCEIREADATGRGALYLRGPNLAAGYWRRADLTDKEFGTGWIRSGDVAEIGSDGAVYLRDRIDDVINRGGEKIYSTGVEEALLELAGVADVAVVDYPDPQLGSKVAAVIVADVAYTATSLQAELSGRLPRHWIPEVVICQPEPLPRGPSGKVLKPEIRSRLALQGGPLDRSEAGG
jgi:long-chain acyl-CoA synthetase